MSVFDYARVIIYRFHEKGLEVFLLQDDVENDPDVWLLPAGRLEDQIKEQIKDSIRPFIELDSFLNQDGNEIKTIAVEADWHDIPSVRGLIKHDVKRVKSKIKEVVPQIEKGTYFAVKEAFKKVLPNEYKALKELKDVLLDRNTVTNI